MIRHQFVRTDAGKIRVEVDLRGRELLNHPLLNKGTVFSDDERETFELAGLLPQGVASESAQERRAYENIMRKTDDLERYIGLISLMDRNETLFYKLLVKHIDELMPLVYTPTVGEGCRMFSRIFRRARGIWITPEHKGRVSDILANAPNDVRLIVVTDNERILGLGDQGAGGMGIPIGKLSLYVAGAGIHPSQVLPISLDVGTDNEELLADELYVGWRHRRVRGSEYDELVEELVTGVKERFPKALLQWEDFKKANAFDLLDRYKERLLSFNDDIQGTAAVALAGVMAWCRATKVKLKDQRIVVLGAGAAGIGIARQLRDALKRGGVEGDALTRAIAVLDSRGLLLESRKFRDGYKREFAWPDELAKDAGLDGESCRDLLGVVRALKPGVLIGTSGQPGAFGEDVVRALAEGCERPAIFPFSNPTSKSEAKPVDLICWTDGKAWVATGSPFEDVEHAGKTHRIGQGNNVYVFPGVGLGALVAEATKVTESMFTVAAEALAESVEQSDLDAGSLYPPLDELREVTASIAAAVVREARRIGVGRAIEDGEVPERVRREMWAPEYPELVAV